MVNNAEVDLFGGAIGGVPDLGLGMNIRSEDRAAGRIVFHRVDPQTAGGEREDRCIRGDVPNPSETRIEREHMPAVRVELGLHPPGPNLRGPRDHVPGLKLFAACDFPQPHVPVPARCDQ